MIGIAEKVVERSPKKFLVDGFDIRVIRRGVEHFCIEKEIVPTLNKFLSAVKEKIYISPAGSILYTVEHTIWDSSRRAVNTGLFISPSGTSELDCATTKTDTAERSISIVRESLQVFFLY